jgi:hypothetical protein
MRLALLLALPLAAACAAQPELLVADFGAHAPRTVVVLQPRNETLQAVEPELIAAFERELRERGYEIGGADADAGLRCTLVAWSSGYEPPPYGYATWIELEADLIDHRSGVVLWRDRRRGGEEEDDESFLGALVSKVSGAFFPPETRAPVALAEGMVARMVATIPPSKP